MTLKRLHEVCASVDYGYTASASTECDGPKFLRITDIVKGFVSWAEVPRCQITEGDIEKFRLEHGDIVIARTGASTGASAFISNPPTAVFASYLVRLRIDKRHDARFVSYYLRSPIFKSHVWAVSGDKSAQPNASATALANAPINFPDRLQQQAIAEVLGSLDDKIELNRRMNKTLEELASAIFKAWFIDFEPVKAKAAGAKSFPSMPQEVFDSLPTELVDHPDAPNGELPKGWRVEKLQHECDLVMGQSPPSEAYNERGEGLPFHQGGGTFESRFPRHEVYCQIANRVAEIGDVLFTVRAPVGRLNVADRRMIVGRGVAAIRHRNRSNSFLLYWLKQRFKEEDSIGDGTIFASVNKSDMESIPMLVPPSSLVIGFERIASPIDEQIGSLTRESSTLASLRDLLLPKLLSGEVRVKDAEKMLP